MHLFPPQGFATTAPTRFNITTLEGYKLYRISQVYNSSFGSFASARFVRFSVKILF